MSDISAKVSAYSPGNKAERKAIFQKLTSEATPFSEPDQLLQVKSILNLYFEVKANDFSSTVKAMVKFLKLYGDYTAPSGKESLRSASLKVANKLCLSLRETAHAALLSRATALSLTIVSKRAPQQPVVEIDLSDEDEVPLSTNTSFSSHRTVLLEDKDNLLVHQSLETRIETLVKERALVREWANQAGRNRAVASAVVFSYAKKDVSTCNAKKTQQYLLKCLSHRIKHLQKLKECEGPPVEVQKAPSGSGMATAQESATLSPSEAEVPKYHSSGTPMPPPPDSGLGKDHPYSQKVVNSPEVQLQNPRVPHPTPREHAAQ